MPLTDHRVRRQAGGKAGDQPAAADAVEHGVFLGDARRRRRRRQGRAELDDGDVLAVGLFRQHRAHQARIGHEAVDVLVMLVGAHAVKAGLRRVQQFVEGGVVVLADLLGVGDVEPRRIDEGRSRSARRNRRANPDTASGGTCTLSRRRLPKEFLRMLGRNAGDDQRRGASQPCGRLRPPAIAADAAAHHYASVIARFNRERRCHGRTHRRQMERRRTAAGNEPSRPVQTRGQRVPRPHHRGRHVRLQGRARPLSSLCRARLPVGASHADLSRGQEARGTGFRRLFDPRPQAERLDV